MTSEEIKILRHILTQKEIHITDCQINLGGNNVQNIYMGKAAEEEISSDKGVKRELPQELKSEKAQKILTNLYEHQYLDENMQPNHLSLAAMSLIAYQVAVKLCIKCVWKVFSSFWGQNPETMRTAYNKAMEQHKTAKLLDDLMPLLDV